MTSINLDHYKSNYDISDVMKMDKAEFKLWLKRLPNSIFSSKLGLVFFGTRTFSVTKSVVHKNVVIVKPING